MVVDEWEAESFLSDRVLSAAFDAFDDNHDGVLGVHDFQAPRPSRLKTIPLFSLLPPPKKRKSGAGVKKAGKTPLKQKSTKTKIHKKIVGAGASVRLGPHGSRNGGAVRRGGGRSAGEPFSRPLRFTWFFAVFVNFGCTPRKRSALGVLSEVAFNTHFMKQDPEVIEGAVTPRAWATVARRKNLLQKHETPLSLEFYAKASRHSLVLYSFVRSFVQSFVNSFLCFGAAKERTCCRSTRRR